MQTTGLSEAFFTKKVLENMYVLEAQYHKGTTWDDFVGKYRYLVEKEEIKFVVIDAAHEIQVRALVRAILSARSTGLDQVAADSGVLEKPPFAPAAFDVTELLDSQMDLRAQLRRASEVATDFDPNCVDASMLEEVSAGFESIAARLRAVASQRESA